MNLAFVNKYFDTKDFSENPISSFIDDSLFWPLESQRAKKANFYIMKGNAQLSDALFQLG